jgi:hypothetical protein
MRRACRRACWHVGGLFAARDQMAGALETISDALPLTYAFDALNRAASAATSAGAAGSMSP